MKTKC